LDDAASTNMSVLTQQNTFLKDALEGCRLELGDVYDRVSPDLSRASPGSA